MVSILQWATAGVYVALGLIATRAWWRDRGRASQWLAAGFVTIGIVAVAGVGRTSGAFLLPTRTVVALLLVTPWLLYRFAHSFAGPQERSGMATFVNQLAVVCVALALAGPPLPGPGEPRPLWVVLYSVAALAYWGLALADGARVFFQAARGQSGVILRRLRRLGSGYAALAVALVVTSAGDGTPDDPAQVVGAVAGVVAGALFLEGFAPGDALRRRWRAAGEARLDAATVELMAATTVEQVTSSLLPAVADMTGAQSVQLLDAQGQVVGRIGLDRGERDTGAPAVVETELHRGVLRVAMSPWSPLLGEEERRLLRRLGTVADLALDRVELLERERDARREAERATRDRDALLAAVAHDMQGPLTAINGFAELLLGPLADDVSGRARNFIGRIADNSQFVAALSADLVELGSAGADDGGSEPVALEPLVRRLADALLLSAPRATVTVERLPVVVMDPTRARQVFDNLLRNAVRHAGRDDVDIRVHSHVQGDGSVDVVVRDNGVGIADPEHRERIFELFERLGSVRLGSGLGLAICRRIMEGLGGSIAAVPSDAGACLLLHFPSTVVAAPPAHRLDSEPTTSAGAGSSTVTTLADVDDRARAWTSGRSSSPPS